jgi:hypothetical protein
MSESSAPHDAKPSVPLMEEPEAPLERMYIEAYLQTRGYTLHCGDQPLRSLCDLPDDEAKRLMTGASSYASTKLAEVESRAHFVEEIHGTALTHPL